MRETAAAKKSRISGLLARYDEITKAKNKLDAEIKELKAQIADVPVGTYGEWIRGAGTAREILDQPAARKLLTDNGIPVPMKTTEMPITVTHVASTK